MKWKDAFKENKELILATCSKDGKPNSNIVLSRGFVSGKLLISDSQMITTINNLKENPLISITSGYYRIKGTTEIFTSGKYFEICIKKSKHPVKNAVLIKISSIFDLDKLEIIK
jgi:hypothetical protein